MSDNTRYIFISGGVVSGLGKGITAASLGLLLKARGFTVSPIKCDMYVNVDAGTMNPTIHGEVFVTDDGLEADQDLGHYERYLNQDAGRRNYVTTGQIYKAIIEKERELYYEGKCVEVVPHVPEEIISRIQEAGAGAEFVIAEFGGTVGEYQSEVFLEATRILAKRLPGRTAHIHVSYFPYLDSLGELKSKPTQLSIRKLNECGILPDFVVARSARTVDTPRFTTLCQNSNLEPDQIIFCPDVESVYMVPMRLEEQQFAQKLLRRLGVTVVPRPRLTGWEERVNRMLHPTGGTLRVGIVAKYHAVGDYSLSDAYVSVVEAIHHVEAAEGVKVQIDWVDAEDLTDAAAAKARLKDCDGIIIPQGWGSRGAEGKIAAIQYARENNVPYFGLCYGMQMAAIEFGRNVLGLKNASSEEVDPNTPEPVVHVMPDQAEIIRQKRFGGSIRVGAWACRTEEGSLLRKLYGEEVISERHRHRYEFNNDYRARYEAAGLVFSGRSPDGLLVEALELPGHPFFVGVQYHPEYKSRLEAPHPLFLGFVQACRNAKREQSGPEPLEAAATAAAAE
ncbi:MAG: CTP synthase [Actinomycetota bacterium]